MPLKLTLVEEEVVFLKATLDAIDSMVNLSVMALHGDDPNCSIMFATRIHQQYFNIGLVDFLSRTDKRGPVTPTSYLGALGRICVHPHFARGGSEHNLLASTQEFVKWLDTEITVNVWFPTIDFNAPLSVSRLEYIKMTGDLSKHNLLRAVGVAEDLQRLLKKQGVTVELEAALLALNSFYEWFHDHVLNYHSSTIAEFLNNIRWAIYDYLRPEFQQSIVHEPKPSIAYRFIYPGGVVSHFGKENYWDLMNLVRGEPSVRKFKVTKCQKLR
jgi:hypothetical protein